MTLVSITQLIADLIAELSKCLATYCSSIMNLNVLMPSELVLTPFVAAILG